MNKKAYPILLAVTLLLLYFGFGYFMLFAKQGAIKWFPFIIIFAVVPFLLYKSLQFYQINEKACLGLAVGSVLVIGPTFGLWIGKISDYEFSKYGATTKGIIIEKWYSKPSRKREGQWLVKCKFTVDNEQYSTYNLRDRKNIYKVGDTLLIQYSKRNPENNEIPALKNN
ncbi:hypothetical protein AHMF7605_02115 [Adhaeribacter arboris]|uniref:DUF3592 domain-containing protein n=1 Tax=Adhaeribacter arboris TaxID=2072846 RepID=A0A2T2YA78_9BACT|nr:hypothetical protein [Adhaeribacter arboris]PSR52403.1 hypothetical protein AHMF7605_02115 [Adhaeribacter arboris]